MVKFSIFAPIYNEEKNIRLLYDAVKVVMDQFKSTWELILVNDGSKDNSLEVMRSIKDKNVKIIDLKKNFGQSIAMDAGFRACQGEYIISLDADLQNDPSDIPKMFKKMQDKNLDVIAGWRYKRKDPLWMLIITRIARFLRGFLVKDHVHDSGCTLRIYKKEMVEDLELGGEMHRYIIALLGWKGARIGEIKVKHWPRKHGETKYTWRKSLKGFVDLLYIWFWKKFSGRPLHLFGTVGIFLTGLGMMSGLMTFFLKFFKRVDLSDSVWFVMTGFLFLGGMQIFIFGIIFDLLIRTYYNTSDVENRYSIKNVYIGGKKKDSSKI